MRTVVWADAFSWTVSVAVLVNTSAAFAIREYMSCEIGVDADSRVR
jgi:hypothetical protein